MKNRKLNKDKTLSYVDITNMGLYNPYMNQYGLGGWLKDNAANLALTVGGAALIASSPLTGGAGIAAGTGLMGQGVMGFKQTHDQNEQIKEQEKNLRQLERDNRLNLSNQRIQQGYDPFNMDYNVQNKFENGGKVGGRSTLTSAPGMSFLEYGGQSHEGWNEGINIDSNGNPLPNRNNAVGLAEKDEVTFRDSSGESYVFSDKLKRDKNSFAKESKRYTRLSKFYNGIDDITNNYVRKELQRLKEEQEITRQINQQINSNDFYKNKRNLPKYDGTSTNTNSISDTNTNSISEPQLFRGFGWGDAALTAIPGLTGMALNLIRAKNLKRPEKIYLGRVTPEQINLQRERDTAIEQANLLRSNLNRNLRENTNSVGQYLSNIGNAQASINRGLYDQLSKSYLNEELRNSELRDKANTLNVDLSARERMYNNQLDQNYYNTKRALQNQAISMGLSSITDAINQKVAANQYYDKLNIQYPNVALYLPEDANWWQRNFQSFQKARRIEKNNKFDLNNLGQDKPKKQNNLGQDKPKE